MKFKKKSKERKQTQKSNIYSFLFFMKKFLALVCGLLVLLISVFIICLVYYKKTIGPVSSDSKEIIFEVKEGDTYYSIGGKLENEELINSEFMYKIYLKLNPPSEKLKVGEYYLRKNMNLKEIITTLSGKSISNDIIITFKEGKNMRYIASVIAQNTNNTEEDVYSLLSDKEYLKELISEYWFIDDSILNSNIYYPLEGYLYPNTYNFKNKDVTVKEIFKTLLDEMAKQIEPYRNEIQSSKYSFHQLLTMGSIIELEAKNSSDRSMVASVFYNRLNSNMPLGSDVTTYYAAKVEMSERDLYQYELDSVNPYNTRSSTMSGKLPVGPICNPSSSSILAALKPSSSDYYFFVADKNGKVYYTKTNEEHNTLINKLKREGLWYTY